MRRPDIANNPDFQRKALVTILGIMVIVGAFWAATSPAETLATVNNDEKKLSASPTPSLNETLPDWISEEEVFGYPVLCAIINTPEFGFPEHYKSEEPIVSTVDQILKELGDQVYSEKVVFIQGGDITVRNTDNIGLYANRTKACAIIKPKK